ncbi:MAG: RDD family protein, partial [Planctomycetaceae bacterium]|nr:RDD family protein [Planctomycetaceae bacterium]
MSIKFRCPECSNPIKAPDEAAGRSVRCPQCQTKTRVPSGSSSPSGESKPARKPKKEEDSNAFLENIDLGNVAADTVLCQKCAAVIPPGETTCPECGFDPEHLTTAGRRRQKLAAKGIDPKSFYANVFKEPFSFATAHMGLVFKTGTILTIFFLLAAVFGYFLIWVATGPPFAFWLLLTTVAFMVPVGWLLEQHLYIIQQTLEKKDKMRKLRFDFALCGMSGMKFFAWIIFYGLPFWIVFGGLGMLLDSMGIAYAFAAGVVLSLLCVFIFASQALSHLAMPVETPGWFFPRVAKSLRITFLPGLTWALLALLVNLPVIGGFAAVYYVGGDKFAEFVDLRLQEAKVRKAKVEIRLAELSGIESRKTAAVEKYSKDAEVEVPKKNFGSIVLPITIGILSCYLVGFTSVVVGRANGILTSSLRKALDLIGSAKELVYKKKQAGEEKIRNRKTTLVAPTGVRAMAYVIDSLLLSAMNGTVLGMIYYTVFSFDVDMTSRVAMIISQVVASIPPLIVFGIYFVKNEAGIEQTTAGKKAMHLFVAQ